MRTVTFEVRSFEQCLADFSHAWESGVPESSARIAFVTQELMAEVLTTERWRIVNILCGAGSMSITEAALRIGRDADEVEADIRTLLNAGVLEHGNDGGVIFPYDEVVLDLPTTGRATV